MDATKRLHLVERRRPFHLRGKRPQHALLALPQNRKWFDNPIAQDGKKFRMQCAQRFQNIGRELAAMRALFDDHEIIGPAELFPNFGELPGHQCPEQRPDADAGEVIAPSPNRAVAGAVIAMLRMIESLLHEPGKRSRPSRANSVPDDVN